VAAARRVVLVADSTKWGVVGLSTIADLEEVDVFVTDDGLPEDARKIVGDRVGRLVLASRGPAA